MHNRRLRPFQSLRTTLLLALLCANLAAVGCKDKPPSAINAARQEQANKLGLPNPYAHYYGVYLNGQKVGWMHAQYGLDAQQAHFSLRLEAKVSGLGTVSSIELEERRSYDIKSEALETLHFHQKAATGTVKVEGERRDKAFAVAITAAGKTTREEVNIHETLEDALSLWRLAQQRKVGRVIKARHFDPSLLKNVEVEHRLVRLEKKLFGGVESDTVFVESHFPALGIRETAWVDPQGRALETHIGGFFVARLEPEADAKRKTFQQDVLVSAVVKTPRSITAPTKIDALDLTLSGFGDFVPPSSDRQKVSQKDGKTTLKLSRESSLPNVKLTELQTDGLDKFLEATPFIQSDEAELREAAKQAIGDAKTLQTAIKRLTRFVYRHIKDEYVPAYSNALEAYRSRRGDCTEHAVLFVALARSLGIPARVAVGVGYWPPGEGFGWHAWAEVAGDGHWYAVDPTWNQPIADATHIKLASGSPSDQARIVMLLGQLQIEAMQEK